MIGEKHELKAIPKRRGNNGKRWAITAKDCLRASLTI